MSDCLMLEVGSPFSRADVIARLQAFEGELSPDERNPGNFWYSFSGSGLVTYWDFTFGFFASEEFHGYLFNRSLRASLHDRGDDYEACMRDVWSLVEAIAENSTCKLVLSWMFEDTYARRVDGELEWIRPLFSTETTAWPP